MAVSRIPLIKCLNGEIILVSPGCIRVSDTAVENVEGGKYISSEFQLGQVYMGDEHTEGEEDTVLYRPVYPCVPHDRKPVTNTKGASASGSSDDCKQPDSECEEINVVQTKRKSLTKGRSFRQSSMECDTKLKPEVVIVDEVSNAEPWDVVALKKD